MRAAPRMSPPTLGRVVPKGGVPSPVTWCAVATMAASLGPYRLNTSAPAARSVVTRVWGSASPPAQARIPRTACGSWCTISAHSDGVASMTVGRTRCSSAQAASMSIEKSAGATCTVAPARRGSRFSTMEISKPSVEAAR